MAFDPKGRIIVSREDKGLLRMTIDQAQAIIGQVETVDETLLECRGLLWAYDSLYANANNSKGLYRLRDTDGDDRFDEVKLLKATGGDVGHGRNDLALGPDGLIYSIHGDDVRLPDDYDPAGSPLRNYLDARLLPCPWDRQYFNASMQLPGGYVARTDRDGQRWEVVAGGMRNPFGIAFGPSGELFTYDADMEWDAGMPWYRPTRILHLVSGADFGWRKGTGPWRSWYPDSLPSVCDIGLGSPTAVRFGTTSRFPERYRRALFACDWTFGRILAVQLQEKGASFSATVEPFLSGRPLNVTDVEFGPDGAMYFLTGGRKTQSGLYRVTFVGEVANHESAKPPAESAAAQLRKQLETLHRVDGPPAIETIWPPLSSDDPFVRHAARVALELRPVATWRDTALRETDPTAATTALLALSRVGSADMQAPVLKRLAELPWDSLTTDQRVAALRAWSLILARFDRPSDEQLAPLAALLARRYPDSAPTANELICELLVYLRSPQVVSKTLGLLQAAKTQEERLQYLFLLRGAAGPWTLAERRAYFDWLRQARHFYGAKEMPRFLALIKADAVAGLSEAENSALAPLLVDEPPAAEAAAPQAERPFVRDWKLNDLVGSLEQVGKGRDLAAGKKVFTAASCIRCHRFGGDGAPVGPDLTPLARRFGRVDMLLSILAPSRRGRRQISGPDDRHDRGPGRDRPILRRRRRNDHAAPRFARGRQNDPHRQESDRIGNPFDCLADARRTAQHLLQGRSARPLGLPGVGGRAWGGGAWTSWTARSGGRARCEVNPLELFVRRGGQIRGRLHPFGHLGQNSLLDVDRPDERPQRGEVEAKGDGRGDGYGSGGGHGVRSADEIGHRPGQQAAEGGHPHYRHGEQPQHAGPFVVFDNCLQNGV